MILGPAWAALKKGHALVTGGNNRDSIVDPVVEGLLGRHMNDRTIQSFRKPQTAARKMLFDLSVDTVKVCSCSNENPGSLSCWIEEGGDCLYYADNDLGIAYGSVS